MIHDFLVSAPCKYEAVGGRVALTDIPEDVICGPDERVVGDGGIEIWTGVGDNEASERGKKRPNADRKCQNLTCKYPKWEVIRVRNCGVGKN